MRHRIFVGSSTEDLTLANAIQRNLAPRGHIVKVWNQGIFSIGRSAFDSLLLALDKFDAAVFVFAPNDLVTIRGTAFDTVRDNVVFELGLFTGRLGRDRTFWVVPHGQTQLRIASDLLGVLPAEYVPPVDHDWVSALGMASNQIDEALSESARSRGANFPPLSAKNLGGMLPKVDQVMRHLSRTMISNPTAGSDGGVRELPDGSGFRVRLGTKSELEVTFGRIEDYSCDEDGSVVALPANEFFDDDCLTDRKSALGAFVCRRFADRIDAFKTLVATQRGQLPAALVEREEDLYQESYGVGTALYFGAPLGLPCRMILSAVTRKRAGEGIKAEPAYIFAAVNAISRVMNDAKLTTLYVPLLGSGHGDLAAEVALLCLALALVTTPDIRHANIVVFRRNADAEPDVEPQVVRNILAHVAR